MHLRKFLFIFLVFLGSSLQAVEQNEIQFCGQVRVNLIKSWDKLLTWTLKPKIKPYLLTSPIHQKVYRVEDNELKHFDATYGFYSLSCPLVGVVTKEKSHLAPVNQAMQSLSEIADKDQRKFSRDEILCKVVAYRNLEKGMRIQTDEQIYIVDEIIDLWRGMPAFGLVPEKRGTGTPILLFRGTDMNLISEKGWASILSDLDTTGPGHATFLRARPQLQQWLEKVKNQYEPAQLMGYSLGGAFVFYTLIYEPDLISKNTPSVTYNPPGISKDLAEKWGANSLNIPVMTYVNQGDVVSQIGFFLSDVWEVTLDQQMDVLQAHLTLVSAQPIYKLSAVDVERENRSRL